MSCDEGYKCGVKDNIPHPCLPGLYHSCQLQTNGRFKKILRVCPVGLVFCYRTEQCVRPGECQYSSFDGNVEVAVFPCRN